MQDSEIERKMSGRIRRTSGKSSSSLEKVPEANVAKLRKKLTDREEQKDAEIHASWHDKPKRLPSPSDREEYLVRMAMVNKTTAWVIQFLLPFNAISFTKYTLKGRVYNNYFILKFHFSFQMRYTISISTKMNLK
jgi:hypothetical protein